MGRENARAVDLAPGQGWIRVRRPLAKPPRWCRLVLIALWICSSYAPVHASQSLHFEHLRQADGLSQGFVTALAQDHTGFLWIGTQDGLNRFDGYRFVTYVPNPDDPGSLPSANIRALLVDRSGTLWVGTRAGGLSRYDAELDRFESFLPNPDDPTSLSSSYVTVLYEDRSGTLWVGTRGGGLNRFDRDRGTFTVYRHDPEEPDSLARDSVSALLEDRESRFWVGTRGGGLDLWQPETQGFIHHPWNPERQGSLPHGYVRSLFEDSKGRLWVGTAAGACRWIPGTKDFTSWSPGHSADPVREHVRAIVEDSQGNLWIALQDTGLYRIGPDESEVDVYRSEPDDPNSLTGGATALLVDRTGVLWIGTPQGVDHHDPRTQTFRAFRRPPSGDFEAAIESIWALAEDGAGGFWVGDDRLGLRRVDATGGDWSRWRQTEDGLPSDSVFALAREADGDLWVGTRAGLAHLAAEDQSITQYDPRSAQPLADRVIYSLLLTTEGRLWIGTNSGLARFTADRQGFEGIDFGLTRDDGRPRGPSVFALAEDRDGTLWLGSFANGLYHLDPDGKVLEHFTDEIPSPRVNALHIDSTGVLWAGSPNGLYRRDPSDGSFSTYRRAQGLPTDTIASIVEGPEGALWLGTTNGLVRLDADRERITVFTTADGLPSNDFNQIAATRSRDGILAFGTKRGFVRFDPRSLPKPPVLPPPVITDVLVFNESASIATDADEPAETPNRRFTLPVTATLLSALAISHRESVLSFEFTALHFSDPRRTRYRYQLDGLDERWIPTDSRHRLATYTSLPAGDYTFRVQAARPGEPWSEETRLALHVAPAPWRSGWAYTLYGLLFLGVVGAFVHNQRAIAAYERRRADEEERVNRELRRVDRLKDEFLANTSHELRTPLHGIVGLAESLLEGVGGPLSPPARSNLAMIISSGHRLSNLIDDVLDFTQLRNESIQLHLRTVDLEAVVDVVLTLSRPLVAGKELQLMADLPTDLPPVRADENRLQQILYNLVGNAIKFTDRGSVVVSATPPEAPGDRLAISVRDTGIGIDPAEQRRVFESFVQAEGDATRSYGGTGLGLAVSRQLVELHGGDLRVVSKPGEGSTFTFTLPIAEASLSQTIAAEKIGPFPEDAEGLPAMATASDVAAGSPPVGEELTIADVGGTASPGSPERTFQVLVVDDEPVIRQVLVNQLELHDYQVAEAVDGPTALRYLERQHPDLVLLDVMMPRMSGFDVCRRIREEKSRGELPVIYLSARNQVDDFVTGLGAGGNDYLTKPIRQAELLARVRTHLELLESHRDLEQRVRLRTEELSLANAELARLANIDGLTGLANRRHFDEELSRQWAAHQRGSRPLSLLLCDVDHFKLFNDHYGHQAGDAALQAVAAVLTASTRRSVDFVARFGGEEFVLLLPETDTAGALAIAQVLRDQLRERGIPHEPSPASDLLTLSIGIATQEPEADQSAADFLQRSDRALYRAKGEGRDRYAVDPG